MCGSHTIPCWLSILCFKSNRYSRKEAGSRQVHGQDALLFDLLTGQPEQLRAVSVEFGPLVIVVLTVSTCRYKLSEDAKCLLTHRQPGKPYEMMAWCENGTLVATLGSSLYFLDSSSGRLIDSIPEAHSKSITSICVSSAAVRFGSATGYVVSTGSKDQKARIWAVPGVGDS